MLSAKSEFDGDSTDIKDDTKTIDFGLGYKLENGLKFGARYNLGLANIAEDAGDDFKITNNVIQVSVGFFF